MHTVAVDTRDLDTADVADAADAADVADAEDAADPGDGGTIHSPTTWQILAVGWDSRCNRLVASPLVGNSTWNSGIPQLFRFWTFFPPEF